MKKKPKQRLVPLTPLQGQRQSEVLCKLFDECDPEVPVQAGRHEWRSR
jgi:hypothetical protein